MNARVAAHRAGYRRPRRYAVPTYDPDRDRRWGRYVFGECRPLAVVGAVPGGVVHAHLISSPVCYISGCRG